MWKNTFLCRKDPFEIPGGIGPISDLFRASAKQMPPLRNQTTGGLWEPLPRFIVGLDLALGGLCELPLTQRLVEGWLSRFPRVLSTNEFFAAVTLTHEVAQQILTDLLFGQAIPKLEVHPAANGHQDWGRPGNISTSISSPRGVAFTRIVNSRNLRCRLQPTCQHPKTRYFGQNSIPLTNSGTLPVLLSSNEICNYPVSLYLLKATYHFPLGKNTWERRVESEGCLDAQNQHKRWEGDYFNDAAIRQ